MSILAFINSPLPRDSYSCCELLTNRHCSDQASTYNKRHEDGIKQLTDDIRERRDWISTDLVDVDTLELGAKPLRVLDYACGTGLVSHVSNVGLMAHVEKLKFVGPRSVLHANHGH
jgi:hypothetical protein